MNVDADIVDAMFLWLENHQTVSPPLRISGPLVKFSPRDKEQYLRGDFLPNETGTLHVGAGSTNHIGIFQISVVLNNSNQGIVEPMQLAGAYIEQFKKGTIIWTPQGRKIKIPRQPWAAALVTDSVRPMIPISVPYQVSEPTN